MYDKDKAAWWVLRLKGCGKNHGNRIADKEANIGECIDYETLKNSD